MRLAYSGFFAAARIKEGLVVAYGSDISLSTKQLTGDNQGTYILGLVFGDAREITFSRCISTISQLPSPNVSYQNHKRRSMYTVNINSRQTGEGV